MRSLTRRTLQNVARLVGPLSPLWGAGRVFGADNAVGRVPTALGRVERRWCSLRRGRRFDLPPVARTLLRSCSHSETMNVSHRAEGTGGRERLPEARVFYSVSESTTLL